MTPAENPLVQKQYDAFPYPERNPADERSRLISTWLDDLRMVNHHCFGGAHSFRGGFRVLVAGGGTGDGTVFLAEQLRGLDAEVVHLDISRAALDIARERVRLRDLRNVRFVEASLLDAPRLGLGHFDYINCCGVLHHLPEPPRGLDALLEVMAPTGALGILLYELVTGNVPFQSSSFHSLILQHLQQAVSGAMTFDDLLANVEFDVNTAIQDGQAAQHEAERHAEEICAWIVRETPSRVTEPFGATNRASPAGARSTKRAMSVRSSRATTLAIPSTCPATR